ncbi:hypothetical protein D3C71_772060 [compost metagenome]
MLVVGEPVDRQKLDRGNAEALDIIDGSLVAHTLERAAQLLRQRRIELGKTFNMGLVDNGLRPGDIGTVLVLPVECIRIDHLGLRREWRAVPRIEGEVLVLVKEIIGEMRLVPLDIADKLASIWVDQKFARVETMAGLRLERTVDAKPI